jgi:O-antigen ligase
LEQAFELSENAALTVFDPLKQIYSFLLLSVYGMFLCSYFFFDEYSDPYRFFARVLFVLGLFVFDKGVKSTWRHPVFYAIACYMTYLLVSSFWSDPLDWYRLGQKFTICVYLFSFIATTYFLVNWNRRWFERMLQMCTLVAAVAAAVSILVFYSENPFPATRLDGIGSLTNINEFANVYGVFAILAIYFAIRSPQLHLKAIFFLAIGAFICVAWFGQSRTAFASLSIALLAFVGLTLSQKKLLYVASLAALATTLFLLFPDVLEQAYLRGQGLRPLIWTGVWNEAVTKPIFGHGFSTDISVYTGGRLFETAHNAYLQVFWQTGAVGLFLFLMLLMVAFRSAWSWGRERGDYSVFCMLLFAACTMMTGVDSLIDRPRDQWMLFWFPLALLLSYQSGAPVPQLRTARPMTEQPSE